jgi:regulator of replication initiation timing
LALSVGAALGWAGTLWNLARKVQGLLEAQEKAAKAIAALDEDNQALRLELERLKGREELLIARAEAAASGAATIVVSNTVADAARRIGALEERARRLLPPEA